MTSPAADQDHLAIFTTSGSAVISSTSDWTTSRQDSTPLLKPAQETSSASTVGTWVGVSAFIAIIIIAALVVVLKKRRYREEPPKKSKSQTVSNDLVLTDLNSLNKSQGKDEKRQTLSMLTHLSEIPVKKHKEDDTADD